MSYAFPTWTSTVADQRRVDRYRRTLVFLVVAFTSLVLAGLAMTWGRLEFTPAVTALLMVSTVVVARPTTGPYFMVFLVLFTDSLISPWYPFAKNFSSWESILYVADAITISPLEIVIGTTAITLALRHLYRTTGPPFVRGRLLWPLLVFSGFIVFGLVRGLTTGGDLTVAIWEARPILYLPVVYVLVTNLFTNARQYRRLAIVALVALIAHSLLAIEHYQDLPRAERVDMETLVVHSSAVQFGVVVLAAAAAWLFTPMSTRLRLVLTVAAMPIAWVFVVTQRRAAVIGFAVGIIFLGALVAKLHRRRLRIVGPVFGLMTVAYLGAFWRSDSLAGFPAQAIKSVIAPGDRTEKDVSSDLYRILENLNINATIKARPLTGIGFGQKFYRPYPLADISFFPFYEYIPHNSILWMWIKTGIGGFVAMLFLLASAIGLGTRAVVHSTAATGDRLLAFSATSFVIMYTVFAYVDIAWDARSVVLLAVSMAVCSELPRLSQRDAAPPPGDRPGRGGRRLLRAVPQPEPERRPATTVASRAA